MRIAPLAEIKDRLSAYIDAAKETAIVVTRNGKPVALLTPIREDDDLDSLLLTHDRRFIRLLAQARDRVAAGQYLTNEQFWRELRRRRTRRGTRQSAPRAPRTERPAAAAELGDGAQLAGPYRSAVRVKRPPSVSSNPRRKRASIALSPGPNWKLRKPRA